MNESAGVVLERETEVDDRTRSERDRAPQVEDVRGGVRAAAALDGLEREVVALEPPAPLGPDPRERAELHGHHPHECLLVEGLGERQRDRLDGLQPFGVVRRDGGGRRLHERREAGRGPFHRPRETRQRRPRLRRAELEGASVDPGERARLRRIGVQEPLGVVLGAAFGWSDIAGEEDRHRVPPPQEAVGDHDRPGRPGGTNEGWHVSRELGLSMSPGRGQLRRYQRESDPTEAMQRDAHGACLSHPVPGHRGCRGRRRRNLCTGHRAPPGGSGTPSSSLGSPPSSG